MLERSFTGTPDHVIGSTVSMFEEEHDFAFLQAPEPRVLVDAAPLGASRLFRVVSTGHRIDLTERSMTTVLLIRRGAARFRTRHRDFTAKQGDLVVMTPNSRVTSVTPDARGSYVADVALLKMCAASIGDSAIEEGAPFEQKLHDRIIDRAGNPLQRYLAFLFSEIERKDTPLARETTAQAAETLLIDEVAHMMMRTGEQARGHGARSPSDVRLVSLAEDVMRDRIAEPLAIATIAADLGVSARRLQMAFGAVAGMSPRARLADIRLEAARQALLKPGPFDSVSTAAYDAGFVHLGRFARAYFERFGEFPSQTLRREKG